MRRRAKETDESGKMIPARLRRYDPLDWPNPKCHPECAFWEAVGEWQDQHWDDDSTEPLLLTDGPDEPWHPERL